jgi:hypothetical protein
MNDNARMAEYVATAKRGTMKTTRVIYFTEQLYEHWYQVSAEVPKLVQPLTDEQLRKWFISEIETIVKHYQEAKHETNEN